MTHKFKKHLHAIIAICIVPLTNITKTYARREIVRILPYSPEYKNKKSCYNSCNLNCKVTEKEYPYFSLVLNVTKKHITLVGKNMAHFFFFRKNVVCLIITNVGLVMSNIGDWSSETI